MINSSLDIVHQIVKISHLPHSVTQYRLLNLHVIERADRVMKEFILTLENCSGAHRLRVKLILSLVWDILLITLAVKEAFYFPGKVKLE